MTTRRRSLSLEDNDDDEEEARGLISAMQDDSSPVQSDADSNDEDNSSSSRGQVQVVRGMPNMSSLTTVVTTTPHRVARLWITSMSALLAIVMVSFVLVYGSWGALYSLIFFCLSYHLYFCLRLTLDQDFSPITSPEKDGHRVKAVDFHPQHFSWILMAMYSGNVAVWKMDNQQQHQQDEPTITFLVVSKHPVRVAKFLPDATDDDRIVTASDDGYIRILSLTNKRLVHAWRAHDDYIRSLDVLSTSYLVSSGDDCVVHLWDLEFQARIDSLVGHEHYVMQVKAHPHNASLVATASLDRTIKLWKLDLQGRYNYCRSSLTGQQQALVGTLEGHERGVNCLDFLPVAVAAPADYQDDASSSPSLAGQYLPYLVSGSDDCTVRVWNYQTLELLHTLRDVHMHNVNAVLFCNVASCLVSASEDGKVVLWHVPTWQPLQTISHGMGFAWNLSIHSKDSRTLAIAYEDGCVYLRLKDQEESLLRRENDKSGVTLREQRRWRSRPSVDHGTLDQRQLV